MHPTRLLWSGPGLAERDGCDAAFPQIDLVLVDHGGATDLGWCD